QSWYTDEDDHEEMKITLVGQPHPASSQPQGVPQSPTLHAGPENDPGGAPQAALINPAASANDPAGQGDGPATGQGDGPATGQGDAPPAGQGDGPRAGLPDGVATTFFDVPARGRNIVYLIDASSSMGPGGELAVAAREVLASVRRLPADVKFQVLT